MSLTREQIIGKRGTWTMSHIQGVDWSKEQYVMTSNDGFHFQLTWFDKKIGRRSPGSGYTAGSIHRNWRFAPIGRSSSKLLLLEEQ